MIEFILVSVQVILPASAERHSSTCRREKHHEKVLVKWWELNESQRNTRRLKQKHGNPASKVIKV
jgi:hypothetical protein